VAEVLVSLGMPKAEVERILVRLIDLGVLTVQDEADATSRAPSRVVVARTGPSGLRDAVERRRRERLREQLQAAGQSRNPDLGTLPEPLEEDDGGVPPRRIAVALAAEDDDRLDDAIALSREDQRWILALADGQERLTPFEFLGIEPTHDGRHIRRAFHETSRRLHPDAYYGRDVGPFRELLGDLFRRAKFYYAELRSEEVRTPYVDQSIAERAELARRVEAAEEAERATQAIRRAEEEAEAALRRRERAERRADQSRERARQELRGRADAFVRDAQEAETAGNLARAANFYRLALQSDPNNVELEGRWEACRAAARRTRAVEAHAQAQKHLEFGQTREAALLLVEAADADPTLRHLVDACDAMLELDPTRARDYAMAAFDALVTARAAGIEYRPAELAGMHVKIGRAFLAVGQKESARQQAVAARDLRPDDPEVRALLKSLKVK